jgi:hypothetical protein
MTLIQLPEDVKMNIKAPTVFGELKSFTGVEFFGMDLLHL